MNVRLIKIQDWEKVARDANFEPAAMAALCSISLRQLERFYGKQFNKTPKKWTRELKCRLALQLISKGWFNKAVADELQFSDSPHLCREFKRVYGVPPQTFAPSFSPSNSTDPPRPSPSPSSLTAPA